MAVNYGHPVLRAEADDVLGCTASMDVSLKVAEDRSGWELSITMHCDNESILANIEAGHAAYVVDMSCSHTGMREFLVSETPVFPVKKLEITDYAFKGMVHGSVRVTEDVFDYQPAGMHPDYGDTQFFVEMAQPLAIMGSVELDLGVDHASGSNDILHIDKKHDQTPGAVVSYDDQKIVILLPAKELQAYERNKRSRGAKQALLGILPPRAIDGAFHIVASGERGGVYADFAWYGRIKRWLEENNVKLPVDDPGALAAKIYEQVQLFLSDLLCKSICGVDALCNSQEGGK